MRTTAPAGKRRWKVDRLLLRPEDAAQVLSIGRSKLYELLASGRLDSVTIDGCRRIRLGDIEAFVAALSIPASESLAPSTVGDGDEPSGAVDLAVDQPLLFPDASAEHRRRRPDS